SESRGSVESAGGVTAGGRHAGTGSAAARRGTGRSPYLHRHRPGVEVLEGRPLLAAFVFDPDGPGVVPAQLLNGLDFQPGDALADNAAGAPVGSTFQLYYQARLGGV